MYLAAVRIDAGKFGPLALLAYESMRSPDPFDRRRWADTLLLLDRYEEAERLLAAIDDKPSRSFVAHSLSRAVLGLGRQKKP
ncbi:hypothetical protein [Mesorhizobium onobrychidis]|uniref:Tetratricopeptide repeat protein n=1 Tax=Mesorhizobium onobrychidis TaxID=2775404 RepID=A0ABY5R0Q8_9HYPH|nr:hypothetical protein [Mesorhizobium onobrychidis]UVC17070.1 hypothetical protein IHQ72_08065 [Mesorhizobium onobrychidis]